MSKKFVLVGLLLLLAIVFLYGNTVTVSGWLTARCCDKGIPNHTILIEQQTHHLGSWHPTPIDGNPVTKPGGFFGPISFERVQGVSYRARARAFSESTSITGSNDNLRIRVSMGPHTCESIIPISPNPNPIITSDPGECS